jgi:hypothetical protein
VTIGWVSKKSLRIFFVLKWDGDVREIGKGAANVRQGRLCLSKKTTISTGVFEILANYIIMTLLFSTNIYKRIYAVV